MAYECIPVIAYLILSLFGVVILSKFIPVLEDYCYEALVSFASLTIHTLERMERRPQQRETRSLHTYACLTL